MISIVIPLYNKEKQIARTLQCVLNQTFQDFEVIIINDGSTDNSVIEIQQVRDKRIKLIHQPNAGVSAARNRGIEEARFELIAFLDADDEWKPTYLETQYRLYQKYPECSVYACNYEFQDTEGRVTPTIIHKLPFGTEDGILSNYFEVASCSHPPLWTSAVMVKKEAIQSIGGFPIGIKSGEDLLTWARLAVQYQIAYCIGIKAVYNQGDGYDYSNLPPRKQDDKDPVGKNLYMLFKLYPNIKGTGRYLSHWHKMRASVAIRFGDRKETMSEVFKSFWYNPFNFKVMPFLILAMLPNQLRISIIKRHGK